MVIVRRALVILFAGTLGYSGATWGQALSSNEPSGRVGRLAFTQGTVSYHDSQRTDWEPATINQPMSTGDAIWTEPGARSELSVAGARIRLDGGTQLLQVLLVLDTEALLFVDDHQSKIFEKHVVRDDAMRADDDVDRTVLQSLEDALLLCAAAETTDDLDFEWVVGHPL